MWKATTGVWHPGKILKVRRSLEKREEGGEGFHDDVEQHPFTLTLAY